MLVEALLVDGVLCEVRLDDVQFAEMPSATTISTDTFISVVVRKVAFGQFAGSIIEDILLHDALIMIVEAPVGLGHPAGIDRCIELTELSLGTRPAFQFSLESWFLCGNRILFL